MNNNRFKAKTNVLSLFLSVILVTGTIALSFSLSSSSSFITNANSQPYYNSYEPQYPSYKPDYKTKYSSDNNKYKSKDTNVNVNKIKCINTNLNINGNNTGDVNIGNKKKQGYSGANSYGGGYYDGYDNNKQGKGFDDCVINNNNNNTNIILGGVGNIIDSGGNVTEPSTTLTVTKTVACERIGTGEPRQCPEGVGPEDFQINIIANNPSLSEFPGSSEGTLIMLGAGNYTISENPGDFPAVGLDTTFSGNCTKSDFVEGKGTIAEGEEQTCAIHNDVLLSS